jgi:precorrin-2/cobalt-factor-2 C20-methyltransferase
MTIGTLFGVSVGTGDPELITIKGLRQLQRSPIIAFPAGIGDKLGMAQQIIAPWLSATQIQLALEFPYVQDADVLTQAWQVAAAQIWQHLKQGEDVAFACEGDASFYSTFNYLAQTLQQNHPEVEIVVIPGVCSPLAAAAALGIPLTVRSQRLIVLPALYNMAELETALQWADVVVLMKVSSVYEQVWTLLERHQWLDRAVVVEWATLPHQVIHRPLSPSLKLSYFSVLIVQSDSMMTLL